MSRVEGSLRHSELSGDPQPKGTDAHAVYSAHIRKGASFLTPLFIENGTQIFLFVSGRSQLLKSCILDLSYSGRSQPQMFCDYFYVNWILISDAEELLDY